MEHEPQDLLSEDAKRRIGEARHEADGMQRAHKGSDYWAVNAERKVLSAMAREYVAAGISGKQLYEIRELAIMDAVCLLMDSLGLPRLDQRWLEGAWDSAVSKTGAPPRLVIERQPAPEQQQAKTTPANGNLGVRLKAARKKLGMNQGPAADNLGISERQLQRIESGEVETPHPDTEKAIQDLIKKAESDVKMS